MNSKVKLTIISTHERDDEPESDTAVHYGEYKKSGSAHIITYKESDAQSGQAVDNIIKLYDNKMKVLKSGSLDSKMIFEQDKENKSRYTTPYGDMSMGIYTNTLTLDFQETTISAKVEYELFMNGDKISDSAIEIIIEEV